MSTPSTPLSVLLKDKGYATYSISQKLLMTVQLK